MKIGDLIVPITQEWDKRRYTVLDVFISEKNGDRLVQVGFIGAAGTPSSALVDERLFELFSNEKLK
jgi:hypothetical protein